MDTTIVFFGSGPVAAESLRLLAQDFQIETVITKSATIDEMSQHAGSAPVHAVSTRQELDELIGNTKFQSRVAILIDFGIIVSQKAIDAFPLGIINSHFSLLPEWRGADPITFAILSGQDCTGVSLMLLVEAMDEGPLLSQAPYDIPEGATTPELTDALIQLSYKSLKEIIPLYLSAEITPAPQIEVTIVADKTPTYSRKLTKQDGIIDWQKSAEQIEHEIRAFIEWPKSRAVLAGIDVIITQSHAMPSTSGKPGEVEVLKDQKILMIHCAEGTLYIDKLKPAGKTEMTAEAFLAGYGKLL